MRRAPPGRETSLNDLTSNPPSIEFAAPARHPRGLYYLAFTEMWERFSFYGMSALLTLYMVKDLLRPPHAGAVVGLAPLRHLFEAAGPISDVAFASLIYGWYAGLVYFTPLLGGWVADRVLGARRTVMIGAVLMSAGHIAMSFYASFLVSLVLLILGSGFLKGNISGQVGSLYPAHAESMRSRGFILFSIGINIGAAGGPLVTGLAAAIWGWHAGFAVAAVLMLVALAGYVAGLPHLPDDRPRAHSDAPADPLTPAERRRVAVLFGVIALTIPAEIAYPMVWSIGILWVDKCVALATPLGLVPSSWFASFDALGSVIFAPVVVALWAWQARRNSEPTSVTKIGLGPVIIAVAAMLFVTGEWLAPRLDQVMALWALAGYLVMGLAWLFYWPTLLALVSRAAPVQVRSRMMGAAFLSPFVAHTLAGMIGTNFDKMRPDSFWLMDAGIALVGATLILALRKVLTRALD
jgi:POT family proton-dependent oligopeptide transporter